MHSNIIDVQDLKYMSTLANSERLFCTKLLWTSPVEKCSKLEKSNILYESFTMYNKRLPTI